ncbi:NVEALA domain-containing protein [Bacteroides sp. 224]|uniref:NVEALA domain-containing protein n=1 Tax=Bacteroides sp. 224 TaxID=2302936 RepID=UPI0013D13716|nr:NVEALA domain-containing protein [Bacteroides sp. 224]NDV65512.1 hypothetical protein [Bacteroides sp. 224]
MKKKILSGFAVLVVASVATFNVNLNKKNELTTLKLANIEALAQSETETSKGTCGSYGFTGDSYAIVCNVSKAEAMDNYNWWYGTSNRAWCCDSCSSTWYCG